MTQNSSSVIFRIPKEVHRSFKTWCAENGVTMQQVLEWAVKELIKNGEIPKNAK